jgi:hypothetical protein
MANSSLPMYVHKEISRCHEEGHSIVVNEEVNKLLEKGYKVKVTEHEPKPLIDSDGNVSSITSYFTTIQATLSNDVVFG